MVARAASWSTLLAVITVLLVASCLVTPAHAFGAGNIAAWSSLEGRAFRHGDIDDTLAQLAKKAGGFLGRGAKFGGLDIKRVYLGSWLADMSQAMDIGSLEKVSAQNIINIIVIMAFMAFGYVTGEFEVNIERLGAYLPVEHIDNPKGYGAGKDPRQVDRRLRPPVDPRELDIDPRTGMKNYIANESGGWDTSSALVRRRLTQCIETGRQARSSGDSKTLYEAYRLLGRCLHTLEDFPAHSNFCELALIKCGHRNVFPHVGDGVKIRAPDGSMVPPLITGTFGGADFIHSLLGEAQDHLSSASVSDIQKSVRDASSQQQSGSMRDLMSLLGNVPGGSSDGSISRDAQELNSGPSRDPNTMDPQEIYRNIYRIMSFRDKVMMSIEQTIERIPGLSSLIEKISNTLQVFVFTLLEPYLQPILKQALGGLQLGSAEVVNQEDQYEVFNDPQASDPTHSILSKDHFGLVLNETAGNIACIIVRHVVTLVVKAWDDDSLDARRTADECLAVLFHPNWTDRNHCHPVQAQMLGYMEEWANKNPSEIRKLDREHVRSHTNTRSGKAEVHSHGGGGSYGVQVEGQQTSGYGTNMAHQVQGYVGGQIQHAMGGSGGNFFREVPEGMGTGNAQHGNRYPQQGHSSANTPPSSFPQPRHEEYGRGGNSGYPQQPSHAPPHFASGQYGQQQYSSGPGMPMPSQYGPPGGSYGEQYGPPQGAPQYQQSPYGQGPLGPGYGPPGGYQGGGPPGPPYNAPYGGPPPQGGPRYY